MYVCTHTHTHTHTYKKGVRVGEAPASAVQNAVRGPQAPASAVSRDPSRLAVGNVWIAVRGPQNAVRGPQNAVRESSNAPTPWRWKMVLGQTRGQRKIVHQPCIVVSVPRPCRA